MNAIPPPQPHGAKTGLQYWEESWRNGSLPEPLDPRRDNHFYRVLHQQFRRFLAGSVAPGDRAVEIGCGSSRWLPYLNREFGLAVSGIDYSPLGCDCARRILDKAGVPGEIVLADFFEPPEDWVERFDLVVSFGLVEHFVDTADAVAGCARYLRPGGKMITLVPTMRGLYGLAYRLLNRRVYDAHVPLTREALADAHVRAGLTVVDSRYLLGLPGILSDRSSAGRLNPGREILRRISNAYWQLEARGLGVPPNRYTSPYALCLVEKP